MLLAGVCSEANRVALEKVIATRHLPTYSTTFVGRQAEIDDLCVLLSEPTCRLLTLIGLGGIGKTRLALEVAQQVQTAFADGVYFIPLELLQSPDQILQVVLSVLGLEVTPDPYAHLLAYLSEQHILLVMDNFEHLLDGIDLLRDILNSAAHVKILATSRESLRLQEEWLRQVYGLEYPDDFATALTGQDSAIRLFIERAQRLRVDLDLVTHYAPIVRICQLVEGMPLALELAAGWVNTFSCREIAEELPRNSDILAARANDTPERHRSIRAVFEWSWGLLMAQERAVFMNLSVFRGGFQREAAEQVAGATVSTLLALTDKSLVQLDSAGRYQIHELLSQYAAEKLAEAPEQRAAILDLHCDYYATFLHEREQEFRVEQSVVVTAELEDEIDNIRAAWNLAIGAHKIDQIRQALWCLAEFYDFRGWFHKGEFLLGQAVEVLSRGQAVGARGVALGLALAGQGNFLHYLGKIEQAKSLMREGVAVLYPLEGLRETAHSISLLSRLYFMTGDFHEAEKSYKASVALATEVNDYVTMSFGFLNLGFIAGSLGRCRESRLLLQNSFTYFRKIGHRLGIAITLDALGGLALTMGEYVQAEQLCQEAHTYLVALDSRWHLSLNYERRGAIDHALGDYKAALPLLQESSANCAAGQRSQKNRFFAG